MGRSLDQLEPIVRIKADAFRDGAERIGLSILITRTDTTDLVQRALYAWGRRELTPQERMALIEDGVLPQDPDRIVTYADGALATPHGVLGATKSWAFDAVPLQRGTPWWTAPDVVWKRLYKVAEDCGLDALGDRSFEFLSFDPGHFQEPGWRALRAALT